MTDALAGILAQLGGQAAPVGAYMAANLPGYSAHYLGVSHDGSPCLMIAAAAVAGTLPRPLRLQGLSVQYNVPCRLVVEQEEVDRTLSTILCTSTDIAERRYFLYLAELMLRILGPAPPLAGVVSATEHLARMFQALAQPPRRPLTGIIGELLVIARSAAPIEAALAWRSAIDETFDFAAGDLRIEVKATQGRARLHHLSYDQCNPPRGTVAALVSVIVESSGGGQSVGELLREVEASLSGRPDAVMRLREVFADTLGNAIVAALDERFDRQLSEQSMLLFDMIEVPAVRGALPAGVTEVRFRADLSRCTPRPASHFQERCGGTATLIPEA
jgi:hypothetical protein